MSGYLESSTWGHLALIGFWAAVLAVTLLTARRWLSTTPAAAVDSKRRPPPMAHRTSIRPTLESRHQQRG